MRRAIVSVGLMCFIGPSFAEPQSALPAGPFYNDAKLNELRASPEPKKQIDIDTLQLASAHRERAESVEERTNGLWQSWTTSICEGCGNTPSYRKTVTNDFANRKDFNSRNSSVNSSTIPLPHSIAEKPEQYPRRLSSDLSPETVGQIRRMPRQ